MPALPHGWRMRNRDGEVLGPPVEHDGAYYSGGEGESEDGLDIRPDSEGWDDVDDDTEEVSIKCLLCNDFFPAAKVMIEHCKAAHDFDFPKVQTQHNLDFYGSIKLVNYIRSSVLAGTKDPDVSNPNLWSDDKYMQPALEDDALLFNLDDIDERPVLENENATGGASQ